jgi:flagellar biosynthesis/type III secretory pathway protein FliH
MDTDNLPAALADHPLVRRAVEELMMLAQTDLERERYEARRKAQLDYNTGLKVAHLEGLEEGLQKGQAAEKIHTIHLLERKLDRPETPTEQLAQRNLKELSQFVDQLLTQISRPS